jgi:hypothetical protein
MKRAFREARQHPYGAPLFAGFSPKEWIRFKVSDFDPTNSLEVIKTIE